MTMHSIHVQGVAALAASVGAVDLKLLWGLCSCAW